MLVELRRSITIGVFHSLSARGTTQSANWSIKAKGKSSSRKQKTKKLISFYFNNNARWTVSRSFVIDICDNNIALPDVLGRTSRLLLARRTDWRSEGCRVDCRCAAAPLVGACGGWDTELALRLSPAGSAHVCGFAVPANRAGCDRASSVSDHLRVPSPCDTYTCCTSRI